MSARAVVFDLDGTLLDTLGDLAAAVNHALAVRGFPARTEDEVRRFVGNGVERLMRLAVPQGVGEETFSLCLADFRAYYAAHMRTLTRPYAGIPQLLDTLSGMGYALAVVSNKFDSAAKTLCADFFPQCTVVVGERSGMRRKPAPDTTLAALAELGVSPADAVYVGDSEVDIATARAAGLGFVGVAWGFRGRAALEESGADTVVDAPADLPAAIARI